MTANFETFQDAFLKRMREEFVQPVEETGIPDADTVKRNAAGAVEPYIAVQFGDPIPIITAPKSFMGPRLEDYEQIINVQCVAPTGAITRKLMNKVNDVMLGWQESPDVHMVRKRVSGASWPILASNFATEAYVQPVSFGVSVQAAFE